MEGIEHTSSFTVGGETGEGRGLVPSSLTVHTISEKLQRDLFL